MKYISKVIYNIGEKVSIDKKKIIQRHFKHIFTGLLMTIRTDLETMFN